MLRYIYLSTTFTLICLSQFILSGCNALIDPEISKQFNSNIQYEGEWNIRTNLSHGRGCRIWKDGSIYEGWWQNGKASGRGRLISAQGHIYTG